MQRCDNERHFGSSLIFVFLLPTCFFTQTQLMSTICVILLIDILLTSHVHSRSSNTYNIVSKMAFREPVKSLIRALAFLVPLGAKI